MSPQDKHSSGQGMRYSRAALTALVVAVSAIGGSIISRWDREDLAIVCQRIGLPQHVCTSIVFPKLMGPAETCSNGTTLAHDK